MGAFLALLIGIIVFAMLVHSHEGIKNKKQDDENEKSE
jgi:hypothetical protein